MNFGASAYASLLMTITAVFLLIAAQLAVTSSEMDISRMHERYSGLYEIGVSAAEARVREINRELSDTDENILREYMESSNWESQCELKDGALVLTGEAVEQAYRDIAQGYIGAPPGDVTVTQDSGLDIGIRQEFGAPGTVFTITVTNNSLRPSVKNMAANTVKIQGEIIWNPDPPVYTLYPNFDMDADGLDGKGVDDFTVIRDEDYAPVMLSGVHRV